MSTNYMDNKFGLPKPDFQGLPKKKVIWPLLIVVAIVVILIAGKVGYNFYWKSFDSKKTLLPTEPRDNSNTIDQAKNSTRSSSAPCKQTTAAGTSTNTNDSTKPRVKQSISATKKKLATKQNKPLVKPGTYQELKGPQGIYHLVVFNHLDKPSAMKEVQQLIRKNLGVYLILPRIDKGEKYYRVTIGHSKTEYEADEKLKAFNSTFKLQAKYSNIFVFKY
ncbi:MULTISPECIES: hypothetical protein [unclassified Candidatus Cardinium]|uniref:hypothetical protein n=1 Tax=unclassified Candidatus Cardinium TaxID=2641185 RepID=UPI001FB26AC8|nr:MULTISPECIES: hypothetical protein [unclassified Candidatus Cardinium]